MTSDGQTDILQSSAEHTAKNTRIRAVYTGTPAAPSLLREYRQMKDY